MRRIGRYLGTVMGVTVALAVASTPATAAAIVFEAAGASPASIQATVDAFRASLGALNANTGGAFADGRREINWDGVPDNLSDPNPFPVDFFASTSVAGRARGLQVSTPGTGFLVSADNSNPTATAPAFGFPADFVPFSSQRVFSPIGSTVTDVSFFVPGTLTPATVTAFGAVFNDVELVGLTRFEAFDSNGVSVFSRNVQTTGSGGLSFLGVLWGGGEQIARIRLTAGDAALLSNGVYGQGFDKVAMDDFIYAEPQAAAAPVPEPATGGLLLAGLALLARRRAMKR